MRLVTTHCFIQHTASHGITFEYCISRSPVPETHGNRSSPVTRKIRQIFTAPHTESKNYYLYCKLAADAEDTGKKNMRVARIDARFDPTIYIAIGMAIPLSSQPIRRLVRRHTTGFCKRLPSIAASTVLAVCTGAGIPATASGGGPERVKVAFYNTENLFDTIRNPLISDGEYTPQGARRWDTQRYACKIGRIARVLDELNADIVGLAEVENEAVVRDLMFAMRQDYNYIHRNTDDPRGIDVALLYRGSAFVPQRVNQVGRNAVRRQFLVVDGDLYGERVCVVVCHMPSMLNDAALRNRAADAPDPHRNGRRFFRLYRKRTARIRFVRLPGPQAAVRFYYDEP